VDHPRRRTTLRVYRPRGSSAGNRPELWDVTIDEVKQPWGVRFLVLGVLRHVIHAGWRFDVEDGAMVGPRLELIPGVTVPASGPEEHLTLAAARKRARGLAETLSGELRPRVRELSN
jgi:hypothetical protein